MENQKNTNNNDEMDLYELVKLIFTQRLLIILITGLSSLTSIFYVLKVAPIWNGSFNIVIKDENKNNSSSIVDGINFNALGKFGQSGDETQRLILKSPSVLMPVFEYVKGYYAEKDIKRDNLTFKSWSNKDLDIKYQDKSSVLTVNYKSSDKTLIKNVLSLISEKYRNYSKESSVKEITNTINYLEEQKKIMKDKSILSTSRFNTFSIENGIGNIDGFIGIGDNSIQQKTSLENISLSELNSSSLGSDSFNIPKSTNKNNSIDPAGIRFTKQFQTLEALENEYAYLSTKLKPNSPTLNELINKIESYKNSLKRPNEILIEYKLLAKNANRDEEILTAIENSLDIEKLRLVKSPYAWEMISEPTIDEIAIFPNKKLIVISTTILSSIFAIFISLIKVKLSGKIYSKREIEELLKVDYIETISSKYYQLSSQILERFINTNNKSKQKTALINYKYQANIDFIRNENIMKNILTIDFNEEEKIKDLDNLVIILEIGKITVNDLKIINRYSSLYKEKVLGWVLVE